MRFMKYASIAMMALCLVGFQAEAAQYVKGHNKSNGTHVSPYMRRDPNPAFNKATKSPYTGYNKSLKQSDPYS